MQFFVNNTFIDVLILRDVVMLVMNEEKKVRCDEHDILVQLTVWSHTRALKNKKKQANVGMVV